VFQVFLHWRFGGNEADSHIGTWKIKKTSLGWVAHLEPPEGGLFYIHSRVFNSPDTARERAEQIEKQILSGEMVNIDPFEEMLETEGLFNDY
jgi:hypothetical protein